MNATQLEMIQPRTVTVSGCELQSRIAALHAAGAVIDRMSVEASTYTLTLHWPQAAKPIPSPDCACEACRDTILPAANQDATTRLPSPEASGLGTRESPLGGHTHPDASIRNGPHDPKLKPV